MDLTAQAIEKIRELERHADPIVHAPDYNVTGRYFTREADGGLYERTATSLPTKARFYSTESLARQVIEESEHGVSTQIYYSSTGITATLADADDVSWEHTIRLELHPAFARLQRLTKTETFTQKTLIRLLRAEFNGHVDDRIIERFRTLNLKTDGSGQSVIAQGRAGVDKRILKTITEEGGKEIPTEITVTVPVYDLDEARDDVMGVGLLVDVTPDDEGRPEFELTTVINTLSAARQEALENIVARLRQALPEGVPVYYGSV